MINKISFCSQRDAEKIKPNDNILLISFRDPGHYVNLQKGWKNLVEIECHDVDPDELIIIGKAHEINNYDYFTENDALKIKEALNKFAGDEVIIHCLAGRSRSSALAKCLAEKFGCNNSLDFSRANPNPLIFRICSEIL